MTSQSETPSKRVYRALWWPMRTRRERCIWRYGYLVGAITGAFNTWRIMRKRLGLSGVWR